MELTAQVMLEAGGICCFCFINEFFFHVFLAPPFIYCHTLSPLSALLLCRASDMSFIVPTTARFSWPDCEILHHTFSNNDTRGPHIMRTSLAIHCGLLAQCMIHQRLPSLIVYSPEVNQCAILSIIKASFSAGFSYSKYFPYYARTPTYEEALWLAHVCFC